MPVKKTYLRWDRNIGGLNLTATENMTDTAEMRDLINFDLDPVAGLRRRGGLWPVQLTQDGTDPDTFGTVSEFGRLYKPTGAWIDAVIDTEGIICHLAGAALDQIEEADFIRTDTRTEAVPV